MQLRRVFALALFATFSSASLSAQSLNLRDLLTDFFRNGITLADPPAGSPFPTHAHHFVGDASLVPLEELNNELAAQLSTFPLASSAGGFTYRYDPALGTFTRASDSFGPIYAERADTIGKGKFNFGLNFSHFTFDRIDELNLPNGDVQIVLRHQDLPPAGCCLRPFFEGDVIITQNFLKIQTDITAFTLAFGVTDHLDIGAAIPLVSVQIQALTTATIDRLATGGNPNTAGIHKFPNGEDSATFQQSGNASGVGDVVLRAKYRFTSGDRLGLALGTDVRLPTGDDRDLLGTGTTQIKGYVIASAHLGAFSPHINGGYTWSARRDVIPDEINYAAGFDWAIHPRFTLIVDGLGRTFRNGQVLREQDTVFEYNTNPATDPVNLQTATIKQLVATQENSTSFSGSVGFKINPVGNLLLTINGLFSLNRRGLQDKFAPLVGVDYSF
jgi:hypothetical protein